MMRTAMEICQKSLEKGEPLTREYLLTFIDLVNDTEDGDIMLMLMQLLNGLIGAQWSASAQPLACLTFPVPVLDDDEDAHQVSYNLKPWCKFQWPPTNVNGRFSLVAWLKMEHPSTHPNLAFVLGNDHVNLEIFFHLRSVAVSVTALSEKKKPATSGVADMVSSSTWLGTATFEDVFPLASWCQLAINFVFIMESELLQMEIYFDGEWLHRDAISLKSANLTSDIIKDFPRRFQIGSLVDSKEAPSAISSWNYAQSWIFSRKLSQVELLWLYMLGPSNGSLRDVKHARIIPRAALTKKVLARDPRLASTLGCGRNRKEPTMELEQLRYAVLAFHSAANKPSRLLVYQYTGQHHRRSLLSSLFNISPALTDPTRLVVEAVHSPSSITAKDFFVGSWCHALQCSGGTPLLLLVLAKVAQTGDDKAISLAVNALVR